MAIARDNDSHDSRVAFPHPPYEGQVLNARELVSCLEDLSFVGRWGQATRESLSRAIGVTLIARVLILKLFSYWISNYSTPVKLENSSRPKS